MKNTDFADAMNDIDSGLLEKADNAIIRKKAGKTLYFKLIAIAACLTLILTTVIALPAMLRNGPELPENTSSSPGTSKAEQPSENTNSSSGVSKPSEFIISQVPLLEQSGQTAFNKNILLGSEVQKNSAAAELDMMDWGFYCQTVVEVQLIEVLPSTYYSNMLMRNIHVAKFKVLDKMRGKGLPDEIYLLYKYYDKDILSGYDSFIMSLRQIGIDSYALTNNKTGKTEYFPNMFEAYTGDIGYGSVVAFKNGLVEGSFFQKADYTFNFYELSDRFFYESYPAHPGSSVEKVKKNIEKLYNDPVYDTHRIHDYITWKDVFNTEEALTLRDYLLPESENVFEHYLLLSNDTAVIEYRRIVNGVQTEESYVIRNTKENILSYGSIYTEEEIAKAPNIGYAMTEINFSAVLPPHIVIDEKLTFRNLSIDCFYRKADGKVYGIIRMHWSYDYHDNGFNGYLDDDCYLLYGEDGNGRTVEREELKQLFGDYSVDFRFQYGLPFAIEY